MKVFENNQINYMLNAIDCYMKTNGLNVAAEGLVCATILQSMAKEESETEPKKKNKSKKD